MIPVQPLGLLLNLYFCSNQARPNPTKLEGRTTKVKLIHENSTPSLTHFRSINRSINHDWIDVSLVEDGSTSKKYDKSPVYYAF